MKQKIRQNKLKWILIMINFQICLDMELHVINNFYNKIKKINMMMNIQTHMKYKFILFYVFKNNILYLNN